MNTAAALLLLGALGTGTLPTQAQAMPPGQTPPPAPVSLSQIIGQIESRPDFAHMRGAEWSPDHAGWRVAYRTRDGRERVLLVDPHSGRARLPQRMR